MEVRTLIKKCESGLANKEMHMMHNRNKEKDNESTAIYK